MPTTERLTIRFAVGNPKNRSGIWRVWANPSAEDIYIAQRSYAAVQKASLHPQGGWRHAWVKQHLPVLHARGVEIADRVIDLWQPPGEFVPGLTHALSVVVPHSELRSPSGYAKSDVPRNVAWITPTGPGDATEIAIAISAAGQYGPTNEAWPGKTSVERPTRFVGRFDLEDHRGVWAVAYPTTIEEGNREEVERHKRELSQTRFPYEQLPEPRGFALVVSPTDRRYFMDVALVDEVPLTR